MIKYLGSKRALVGVLGAMADAAGARTAVDLFTGTTRVAQEFCRRGIEPTAVDLASYSLVFGQCYVETDAAAVDPADVADALARLAALPPRPGYVTRVFCEQARYFHPENGARIDAVRDGIDRLYGDSPLRPLLLTALLEAADRVDATVGVQMAYLKAYPPRALKPLALRAPVLTPGTGRAVQADARAYARAMAPVDLAYLDPPYNQHRYFTNYHVWETLVRWDAPEHYGVACKRVDARDDGTRSAFNSRRTIHEALAETIAAVPARVVVASFNDEGYVGVDELVGMGAARGADVRVLAFDSRRYVGSLIGIHSPAGVKVGEVGRLRNTEYLVLAGPAGTLDAMVAAAGAGHLHTGDPVSR